MFLITLESGISRRKTTPMKCLSHHIVSRVYAVYMTFSVDTDLDQLAKVVFVCFLHWKVTLYVSPVQHCTFWKKVTSRE